MTVLCLRDWKNFRERTLKPMLDMAFIEPTQPDSPRSPTQKYRLTAKGRAYLEAVKGNG
jgi:ATP-dependent DNA helicase RecG